MFLGQGVLWEQVWKRLNSITDPSISDSGCSPNVDSQGSAKTLERVSSQLKDSLIEQGSNYNQDDRPESPQEDESRAKRRRLDEDKHDHDASNTQRLAHSSESKDNDPGRLPNDLEDALVEIYFSLLHHWIPMLHVRQFREKLSVPSERRSMEMILDAIVSVCCRFSDDPRLGDVEARAKLAKQNRQKVILQSIESFSVENLQALIICAFDTVSYEQILLGIENVDEIGQIGSGRGPSAWVRCSYILRCEINADWSSPSWEP